MREGDESVRDVRSRGRSTPLIHSGRNHEAAESTAGGSPSLFRRFAFSFAIGGFGRGGDSRGGSKPILTSPLEVHPHHPPAKVHRPPAKAPPHPQPAVPRNKGPAYSLHMAEAATMAEAQQHHIVQASPPLLACLLCS